MTDSELGPIGAQEDVFGRLELYVGPNHSRLALPRSFFVARERERERERESFEPSPLSI